MSRRRSLRHFGAGALPDHGGAGAQRRLHHPLELYQKNLNTKMQKSISSRLGECIFELQCKVEEESPDTFGTILNVYVLTKQEEKADFVQEVKTILYQDFGVSKEKVTVLSKESIE